MKKLFLAALFCAALAAPALADDVYFEGIYNNYQVVYYPSTKTFATGGMAEERMVFTKKTSSGTGGYSEYYYKGALAGMLGGNFEFVKDGKLISVHNQDLTFYNVVYKNKKLVEKELSKGAVQKLFPDAVIIPISKFKDYKYTLKVKGMQKTQVILLGNGKKDFYKYSYMPSTVKKTDIAALIDVSAPGRVEFAHYNENTKDTPKYTLYLQAITKK